VGTVAGETGRDEVEGREDRVSSLVNAWFDKGLRAVQEGDDACKGDASCLE